MAKHEKRIIVSVSRRTDIPAFYAEWFMNRVRAGYCLVPNPMNPTQVSCVHLHESRVLAFVFWTRNPRPLMQYLDELNSFGFEGRYYFNFTLMNNPRAIDTKGPSRDEAIRTFRELAGRIGAERVIWRYDPIVLSNITPPDFHLEQFKYIAQALEGSTKRCVISLVDNYKKIKERFAALKKQGVLITQGRQSDPNKATEVADMLTEMARLAHTHGMEIQSCAEPYDLSSYSIAHGKCIDDAYMRNVLGIQVPDLKKDAAQREHCGCVESRDIGAYDTCLFGCQYCYATTSFETAAANYRTHDPSSPMLFGQPTEEARSRCKDVSPNQSQLKQKQLF